MEIALKEATIRIEWAIDTKDFEVNLAEAARRRNAAIAIQDRLRARCREATSKCDRILSRRETDSDE